MFVSCNVIYPEMMNVLSPKVIKARLMMCHFNEFITLNIHEISGQFSRSESAGLCPPTIVSYDRLHEFSCILKERVIINNIVNIGKCTFWHSTETADGGE